MRNFIWRTSPLGNTAVALGLFASAYAYAGSGDNPLSANELNQCAHNVQTLRERSEALLQRSRKLDGRRKAINAQYQRLNEDSDTSDDGGGNPQKAWIRYNAKASEFNDEMAQFRSDVADINEVKKTYEQQCANRPYRDSDFQKLPQAKREAMEAGLSDVRVPYTDGGQQPGR